MEATETVSLRVNVLEKMRHALFTAEALMEGIKGMEPASNEAHLAELCIQQINIVAVELHDEALGA